MDMVTLIIGEKMGVLERRMTDQERRSDKQDMRLDRWARNIRRLVVGLSMWTIALIGFTSMDDAVKFAVAVIHRL